MKNLLWQEVGLPASHVLTALRGPFLMVSLFLMFMVTSCQDEEDPGIEGSCLNVRIENAENLIGESGASLTDPLEAFVYRVEGGKEVPVSGVEVSWQVTGGGGTVSQPTSTTGSNGRAAIQWSLGSGTDNRLTARIDNKVKLACQAVDEAAIDATAVSLQLQDMAITRVGAKDPAGKVITYRADLTFSISPSDYNLAGYTKILNLSFNSPGKSRQDELIINEINGNKATVLYEVFADSMAGVEGETIQATFRLPDNDITSEPIQKEVNYPTIQLDYTGNTFNDGSYCRDNESFGFFSDTKEFKANFKNIDLNAYDFTIEGIYLFPDGDRIPYSVAVDTTQLNIAWCTTLLDGSSYRYETARLVARKKDLSDVIFSNEVDTVTFHPLVIEELVIQDVVENGCTDGSVYFGFDVVLDKDISLALENFDLKLWYLEDSIWWFRVMDESNSRIENNVLSTYVCLDVAPSEIKETPVYVELYEKGADQNLDKIVAVTPLFTQKFSSQTGARLRKGNQKPHKVRENLRLPQGATPSRVHQNESSSAINPWKP